MHPLLAAMGKQWYEVFIGYQDALELTTLTEES
jgi:hypothetical protein